MELNSQRDRSYQNKARLMLYILYFGEQAVWAELACPGCRE